MTVSIGNLHTASRYSRLVLLFGLLFTASCAPDGAAPQSESPVTQRVNHQECRPLATAAERSTKTDEGIRRTVREITSLQLGIPVAQLKDDLALPTPPIGADELDLVELIMELEEEFDILIEDEAMLGDDGAFKPLSVNDLVEIVSDRMRRNESNVISDEPESSGGTQVEVQGDGPESRVPQSVDEVNTDRPRPTAPYQRLQVTEVNAVTVVALVDQVLRDDLDVYELGQELNRLVEGPQSVSLLLDLSVVESVSDALLGKLLTLQKQIEAKSGHVKLCSLQPEVFELLKVIRLDQVFEIYETRADGLTAFQQNEKRTMLPSHFSTIGFVGDTAEQLLALANRVANEAEVTEVSGGKYLRWSSSCGAEVWLQLDRDNKLIGVVPHFSGASRVRVGITARVTRPNETPLDGAFRGYANPADNRPEGGDYPFLFDVPDYCRHAALMIPSIATVQVAAFAHEVSLFDSIESYEASQTAKLPLASKSFIPSGLFEPGGAPIEPPEAYAIMSGHILKAARKVNDLSGKAFYWALVESSGGTFDVVIHETLVAEMPQTGGVVTGSFWLSGRLP